VIHDYVSVGRNTVISAALSITIHKAAMIAPNVYISDYSHEYHDVSTPIIAQGIRNVREVVIGEGCWIGYGTIILPGAMIGNQCVIGANSVVKGVIPDFTVAAGNPAKIIYRYDRDKKIWERTGSNT
jgi:acetyltransferase-like isoleucine patch superfamily enzyme